MPHSPTRMQAIKSKASRGGNAKSSVWTREEQGLLLQLIARHPQFLEFAVKIIETRPALAAKEKTYLIRQQAQRGDENARVYLEELNKLTSDLGLNCTWGADGLQLMIHSAFMTKQEGQINFLPLRPMKSYQGAFLIRLVVPVLPRESLVTVMQRTRTLVEEQYWRGVESENWTELPAARSRPNLARDIGWLYQRITLGKSPSMIAAEEGLRGTTQTKRKSEDNLVTIDDVKKAISSMARSLGIRLRR